MTTPRETSDDSTARPPKQPLHPHGMHLPLTHESAVKSLVETGAALGMPRVNPEPDGGSYVVLPDGWAVGPLPIRSPPRPAATVRMLDADSFVRWWMDHAVEQSRIYATIDPVRFTAVIDDFGTVEQTVSDDTQGQAAWRQFRAVLSPPLSREWQQWTARDRKPQTQLQFAEFVQDALPDIVEPAGADLLQMSLNFEAAQTGTFIAAQRLQDGSHNLTWRSDGNAAGTVRLPELLQLALPVFEETDRVAVAARLRYRVKDGVLSLWYEMVRPHAVLAAAQRALREQIEQEAGTTILLGSPE